MRNVVQLGAVLATALALAVAGCGGDDDEGGGGGGGGGGGEVTGVQEGSGDRASAAQEAAKAQAGEKVPLEAQNVGILQILGAIESAQRSENALKAALKEVGWQSRSCDAEGDPTKMARCADSLLDRNIDMMFVIGVEPSLIKSQLQKAKRQNVPVIEYSGQVTEDPLWAGRYYPDEEAAGRLLAEHLLEKLGEVEGKAEIAVHDFPAPWAAARTAQLAQMVEETDNVEISAKAVTDAANLVQGTQKTVTDQLTQNPELKAFWFAFDSAGQAGGPAIKSKAGGSEFPEAPYVVTFHADLGTIDLMRQGAIHAVADVNYDAAAWIAVDQAAQHVARDEPFDESPAPDYDGFEIFDDEIVTAENLPPEGEYRESANDFVTFFKTKWAEEFEIQGGAQ